MKLQRFVFYLERSDVILSEAKDLIRSNVRSFNLSFAQHWLGILLRFCIFLVFVSRFTIQFQHNHICNDSRYKHYCDINYCER